MFKFIFNDFLLELLNEVMHVRFGSKISRIARKVLNFKLLQRVIGINLVAVVVTMNVVNPTVSAFEAKPEVEIVTPPAVETPVVTTVARRFPVAGPLRITQGYHVFHSGVDIDGVTGDPLYPIMNGRIEAVGTDFFLGNKVIINHGNDYKSVYAHLKKILVKTNQEVDTGSKIGEMGNTGRSFGDHLHLEVYKNGQRVNPLSVLPPR